MTSSGWRKTARGFALCVLVGVGVALRSDWLQAAVTGFAALLMAATWAHRTVVAVVFLGLILGTPWPTPALAALITWVLFRRSSLKGGLPLVGAAPGWGCLNALEGHRNPGCPVGVSPRVSVQLGGCGTAC